MARGRVRLDPEVRQLRHLVPAGTIGCAATTNRLEGWWARLTQGLKRQREPRLYGGCP